MPDLITSVVRVPWHSTHSGYDQLVRYLPGARTLRPPTTPAGRATATGLHALLRHRCPLPFYPAEHCATDLRVLASRRPAHVLYGDEQFWFSRHRTAPTAVTYHQPPARLARLLPAATWRALAPRADRVVVLDPHQREFFAGLLPAERVHLVPHGIDTVAFTPDPAGQESGRGARRPSVLTVGWWLRDWDVLDAVHERLFRRHGTGVDLTVVTRDSTSRPWHPAVRVVEAVSEPELIALYRRATVVLLPLTDATANNALLEALACGTPVVATDAGGTTYYTGTTDAAVLVPPGDPAAATEAVQTLLEEHGTAAHARRRTAARARAEDFAGPLVADQLRAVHDKLEAAA
ncbi:glycosyltransferase family 4 protein [Streptomyces sp. NPDC058459]|uniref:glycosyltransferase family 4 protein n=1 Tax=Streptomyces sp. NPDC058459 TaxID=3346508 RepID=UPI003651ACE6